MGEQQNWDSFNSINNLNPENYNFLDENDQLAHQLSEMYNNEGKLTDDYLYSVFSTLVIVNQSINIAFTENFLTKVVLETISLSTKLAEPVDYIILILACISNLYLAYKIYIDYPSAKSAEQKKNNLLNQNSIALATNIPIVPETLLTDSGKRRQKDRVLKLSKLQNQLNN